MTKSDYIPYGRQSIDKEDIAAVMEVLHSEFLTQGPMVPRFETELAARCHAGHAVAVNSATSALHLACLALDLGPDDELWTTPLTFVASANCGRYCGARIDFVDIDPDTGNMSVQALADRLHAASSGGRHPKVLVAVHFAGRSLDMCAIHRLARRYNFSVIEDASHALGAHYDNRPVGCCECSDITVFSFHPVKIITTAEGGMALTNRQDLAHRMARLRSHGITRNFSEMEGGCEGGWYYQQIDLGYNYRMTDIQAGLGLSQLNKLESFIARRRALARRYRRLLAGMPLLLPPDDEDGAWHLYVTRLHDASKRQHVFDELRAAGIGVNVHYIPVHLQPYYKKLGFGMGDFPAAEAFYASALTLPLHPELTDGDQERVATALELALGE
jgi:UDP-4-amino-4,6-dideoxy-N-acetyl-beta-L-altrosamine transaminase